MESTNYKLKERVEQAIFKLLEYCKRNDWAGYDPYDALNSRIFNFPPFQDSKLFRLVITQLLKRSPINIRSLLLVPKAQNPKAIALFLMAFLKLSKLGLLHQEDLVSYMQQRLMDLRSPNTSYWCWGYSFPWQTRTVLVPRWSPNLVCTSFVANSMLDLYESTGESRCLEMAVSAAEYILNELYWTHESGTACFAYPVPSQRSRVHNANLLGAALLCRVYKSSGHEKCLGPALSVTRYSVSKQKRDGSWHYGESSTQRWIDNFHTGYNLCALKAVCRYAGTSEFESSIRRGFEFYLRNFLMKEGVAKYYHDKPYPFDIHSVSQTLITLLTLKEYDPESSMLAFAAFKWAMRHMWNEGGYFYYQAKPLKIKTSFMRWSQAWMLLALCSLLEHISADQQPATKQQQHTEPTEFLSAL